MASLNSGVLVKLLEGIGKNKSEDRSRPVLLQIRSIIPLLEEGDLWPNQGFFLKLSDSSHAAYVSLPQEHNELVLSNRLQLGQLIYVHRLEAAYPVPLLKGFSLRPGRHRCVGTPVDLAATKNLAKFWGSSNLDLLRNSVHKKAAGAASSTTTTTRVRASHDGCGRRGKKWGVDEDGYWEDCPRSSAPSSVTRVSRRSSTGTRNTHGSWGSADFLSAKPLGGEACSAPVSPVYSEDSPIGCWMRGKHTGGGIKSTQFHKKSRIPVPAKKHEAAINSPPKLGLGKGRKPVQSTEATILWDSLPSSLARHGKEMLEQRDAAMHAAMEALLEASASERLLKCLSAFSRLHSTNGDFKSRPWVDKYLSLQDDLEHTRLIMQSLPSVSNVDTNSTGSVNEVLVRLASERKEKASSWIQEAVASDLSTEFPTLPPKPTSSASPDQNKTPLKSPTSSSSHRIKPNSCAQDVSKHGRNVSADAVPPACWMKETALYSAAELVSSLQNECKRGLLVHVERYLDGVRSVGIPMKSSDGGQIVGVMSHIKRVSDWIDMMAGSKEGDGGKGVSVLEPSEAEACKRVKNKIYGLLLTHIERTTRSGAARG